MVRKIKKKTKTSKKKIIKAKLIGEKIIASGKEALDLYSRSRFGEIKDKKLLYSLPEALYLLEKKKIEVSRKNKKLTFNSLMSELQKIDKKIQTKFTVFKDLRQKGYIIKTALKYGAEFRVYEKGAHPGKKHAKYILFPVDESKEMTWHDFTGKARIAHATKKILLIAIIDEESDITYYEVNWKKP